MSGCSIYNKSVKHLYMCILSYLNCMYREGFYNIQGMQKMRWNVYYCLKTTVQENLPGKMRDTMYISNNL